MGTAVCFPFVLDVFFFRFPVWEQGTKEKRFLSANITCQLSEQRVVTIVRALTAPGWGCLHATTWSGYNLLSVFAHQRKPHAEAHISYALMARNVHLQRTRGDGEFFSYASRGGRREIGPGQRGIAHARGRKAEPPSKPRQSKIKQCI